MMSEEKLENNPQKFRWNKVAVYDSFEDADKKRNILNESGERTKIRRCGSGGSRFKVLTGESVEKKRESKKEKGTKAKTRASRRDDRNRRKKRQNS